MLPGSTTEICERDFLRLVLRVSNSKRGLETDIRAVTATICGLIRA
jgi:hypothetical protein